MLPEQKLPGLNLGWIEGDERAQHEGRRRAGWRFFFFAVYILMSSLVAVVAVGPLTCFFRPPDVPPGPVAHDRGPSTLRKNRGPLGVKLHREPNRDDAGGRVIIL